MDDELFQLVYHIAWKLWPRREKKVQYSGRTILLMYFWSVLRNKPRAWVCDRRNLPKALESFPIPSRSQFGRRLRSEAFQRRLEQMEARLRAAPKTRPLLGCWLLDAKPFPVSPYSKDKQARWGWAYDRKGRGYKLFTMTDLEGHVVSWRVDSMNCAEPRVARELLEAIDRPGYVLGDSAYDSNALHELTAQRQVQLIAPRKVPHGNVGVRARHPNRLHAIDLLESFLSRFGPAMYAQRTGIERVFSRMSSSRVGLDHLPGFIRTLPRVRLWVQAKLILYELIIQ